MTGAQTERVDVPAYVTASAVLLRLAAPFFHEYVDGATEHRLSNYGRWRTFRELATWLLEARAMTFLPGDLDRFNVALAWCPDSEDVRFLKSLRFGIAE